MKGRDSAPALITLGPALPPTTGNKVWLPGGRASLLHPHHFKADARWGRLSHIHNVRVSSSAVLPLEPALYCATQVWCRSHSPKSRNQREAGPELHNLDISTVPGSNMAFGRHISHGHGHRSVLMHGYGLRHDPQRQDWQGLHHALKWQGRLCTSGYFSSLHLPSGYFRSPPLASPLLLLFTVLKPFPLSLLSLHHILVLHDGFCCRKAMQWVGLLCPPAHAWW